MVACCQMQQNSRKLTPPCCHLIQEAVRLARETHSHVSAVVLKPCPLRVRMQRSPKTVGGGVQEEEKLELREFAWDPTNSHQIPIQK